MKPRTLTSLTLVSTLVLMGLSGLVLYILPQGRVAYWTDWHLVGLSKVQWDNLHIISTWVFLVAIPFHLVFNWKPLVKHLRTRVGAARRLRLELLPVGALALLVVVSAVWELPPLSLFLDVSAAAKDAWAADGANEPPFGHAEEVPLTTLAARMGVGLHEAVAALEAAGIQVDDPGSTLKDISTANGLSPARAYDPIRPLVPDLAVPEGEPLTDELVFELLDGTGIGMKTLATTCDDLGLEAEGCRARLRAAGLDDDLDARARAAADVAGLTPMGVVQRMAVER